MGPPDERFEYSPAGLSVTLVQVNQSGGPSSCQAA